MHFWGKQGCVLQQPYDTEVGAGTMHPETFLRVLGSAPYRVAYVQPSRRPADGRYGENPNRLYKHFQYQVILKPSPADIQDMYLRSLEAIGIDLRAHDIRFEEDNWESPTLGAWGIGWQVLLDGLEITQFTYFQQSGGIDLDPISVEITYGLERICAFLQDVESVYDIRWTRTRPTGRSGWRKSSNCRSTVSSGATPRRCAPSLSCTRRKRRNCWRAGSSWSARRPKKGTGADTTPGRLPQGREVGRRADQNAGAVPVAGGVRPLPEVLAPV